MEQQQPMFVSSRLRLPFGLFLAGTAAFFMLSAFFVRGPEIRMFDSPDETANALFAGQFERASNFLLSSPSGTELPDSMRPRSFLRTGAFLIPVGFVGFPMFVGTLAKLFGFKMVSLLILFIASGAVMAWYLLVKALFGRHAALLSAMLLLLQPAYAYYTTRFWYPNVLFISLLIFAGYFFVRALSLYRIQLPEARGIVGIEIPVTSQGAVKKRFFSYLAGFFLGGALALRPSEVGWIFAGLVFAALASRGAIKRLSFFFASLGVAPSLLLVAYMQYLVYGAPFSTGYASADGAGVFSLASFLVAPFGFRLTDAVATVFTYTVGLFWWMVLPGLLGFAAVWRRWGSGAASFRYRMFLWLMALFAALLWFGVYYGSWQIRDRIDGGVSIGVSYARYFLPLYILALPILALGLIRTARSLRASRSVIALLVIALVYFSLRSVWWGADDSLAAVRHTLARNAEVRNAIMRLTPPAAVIVSDRGDKIVFPYREAMAQFRTPAALRDLYEIAQTREAWYETIGDGEDIRLEEERFWKPAGLSLGEGISVGYGHIVRRIRPIR